MPVERMLDQFLSSSWSLIVTTENTLIKTGDVLHDLIVERYHLDKAKGCQCDQVRDVMNMWGPDGCRENFEWIVSKLLREAQRRNWTFDDRPILTKVVRVGAAMPFGTAIARTYLRLLVLEAIRKGERVTHETTNDVCLRSDHRI
jgi:hypothetical protein